MAWVIVLICMMTSCASLRNTGKSSVAMIRHATSSTVSTISDFSDFSLDHLLPGPRVAVVAVREKDLKQLPSGRERALAYENEHRRGFWFFGGPVDFKEPILPEHGSELDGSLLPPRIP
jgi:hypothetical protein